MGDVIERQAAIDALGHMMDIDGFRDGWAVSRANVDCMLRALPSAQPEPCGDAVSRQYILDALDEYIEEYGEVDKEGNHDLKWCAMGEAKMVVKEAPPAQTEPQWIPVSERLPEDGTEVFVYLFDLPSPFIAWIEDTRWYTEDFEVERENEPIAWMPIPEPYRAEEGEVDNYQRWNI